MFKHDLKNILFVVKEVIVYLLGIYTFDSTLQQQSFILGVVQSKSILEYPTVVWEYQIR